MSQTLWKCAAACRKVEQVMLWMCVFTVPLQVAAVLYGMTLTPRILLITWGVPVVLSLGCNILRKWLVSRARRQ
jgi:hypothetical protein